MTTGRRNPHLPSNAGGLARIAAAVLLSAASLMATGAQAQTGRQTFVVTDFDGVRLEAPIEVAVTTGKGASAIGTGDRETLDALDFQVADRTLVIRMRPGITLGGSGGKARLPTRIALTTGQLRRAIVMGAGRMVADRLKSARAEASLSGSGALTVAMVEVDRLDVGLLGAGSITLAGGATLDLTTTISGSGRLDAGGLVARRARIEAEGSADARIGARDEAIATANGTGQLTIIGPARCTIRKIGSSSISCGDRIY